MLRIFRHYIPQLPLILFAGDVAVLVAAFHVPKLSETWIAEGALIPRLVLVVFLVGWALIRLWGTWRVQRVRVEREVDQSKTQG